MPAGRDGWFEASRPIRVENGIRARTARGSIGQRWWSRRFVDILERVCDKGRLTRGRAYARAGQVVDLDLGPGEARAHVQGSRPRPYDVRVRIRAYGRDEWDRLTAALASRALYRAKLLAGEMPTEIEEVFDECGLPLFPAEDALDMSCSCPDWGFPCKHLSAVLYLLAESFDDDPFLVLAWRGLDRETLLGALRAAPAGGTAAGLGAAGRPEVADVPFAERLADFYEPGVSPARLREPPAGAPAPPDLLLRLLDPPPVKARHIPILDLLRPAYRRLAEPPPDEAPGDSLGGAPGGRVSGRRSSGAPSP
ncbi:SWIM zinc finger family protein [Microbispora sp. RL4-1S]|uniref:SWIM zinc finger family protein n=1 Tax=Microbispora oryzae TaxID=2806554 RepID=A0A941AK68_9ACTN|nr:SWIM zinc finger family protein [Microbispora oryzae]MBP2705777.1 SWIM zinc finger family protein [Microbispora oryzae]